MVKRTNINLDMDLVERAAHELGTGCTGDTVHEALATSSPMHGGCASRDAISLT